MSGPGIVRSRTEGLHWRLVDGEVLLLDERNGRYLALNSSGALLWELLVTGATRDQLAQRLVTEYGIGQAQAERDVDALVGELTSRSLLALGALER
jgi:Coenzyme PQQ synthesis protein D (PqqD)